MNQRPDFFDEAACRNRKTEMFFANDGTIWSTQALQICSGCPVKQECLEWATELENKSSWPAIKLGVAGGTTETERAAWRNRGV